MPRRKGARKANYCVPYFGWKHSIISARVSQSGCMQFFSDVWVFAPRSLVLWFGKKVSQQRVRLVWLKTKSLMW